MSNKTKGIVMLLMLAGVSHAVAQPRVLYVGTEVIGGNGDDWIEPGETVAVGIRLFNEGTATALSVSGTLTYLGTNPGVTVTTPSATWQNIPVFATPVLTDPPHFELQLGGAVPCGTVLPFRLEVFVGGVSDSVSFDFTLKAGQRVLNDLKHDNIRRVEEQEANLWGAGAGNRTGTSIARGDINGDGYIDLAVSAPDADSNQADIGIVYLIHGRAEQWITRDLALSTPLISKFFGADLGDRIGATRNSMTMCDVNNDGFDDLLIGAHLGDSVSNSRAAAGEVYLIYGKPTMWADTLLFFPPAGVARFWGAQAGDTLGFGVGCGDLNGDGFDDLILGAANGDSIADTRFAAGEVYIVYGKGPLWGDTDLALAPTGVTRVWGAEANDEVGVAVGAADLNADGRKELVIAAHLADSLNNGRNDAGEVYLIQGQPLPLTDIDLAAPPAGVSTVWGAGNGDKMGEAVAAGDLNRDGFEDLVIGAPSTGSVGNTRPNAGEAYLVYGKASPWADVDLFAPPPGVARLWGAQTLDRLGSSLAAGDLNGDGYADVAIGAPTAIPCGTGSAMIVHGMNAQWTDQDLADPPSTISKFLGPDPCDSTAGGLAAADLNADGYDDLAITSSDGDSTVNSRPDAGELYLWYGKPTDTYYAALPLGSAGPYIDTTLLNGATKLSLACDNCSVQLPIGFTFPFYAESFDSLFVSSDGYLFFSQPPGGAIMPEACMPDRGGANHLIAPYWDDLNPAASPTGGGVYALLQGAAPYRRLTIEWKDVPHVSSTGLITFEVTLFETTGQIHFRYKDLLFGDPGLDNGASAVIGVENRTGAHGVAFSCNVGNILSSTPTVRFVPTMPIFEEHGEQTGPLWTPTGHWHDSTNICEPDQHSGQRGWYYGNDHLCAYSNGFSGALRAPTVEDFPADARLAYWMRLGAQPVFDLAEVQLSTTGTIGVYSTFLNPADTSMQWRYGGVTNLFSNTGDTVDLQFNFSSDSSANSLGWMVDDIQLIGCDASGAPQVVLSSAYAPPQVCYRSTATADAFGSYCGDSFDPVRFQWFQNGAMIPGADRETHTIPDTLPPGAYDYGVEITCESGAMALSAPAPVAVVQPPDPVAPTLQLEILPTRPAPSLLFQWEESAGADDYMVLQDTIPNGSFTSVVGTAPTGSPSLSVPIPPGDFLYFHVAGRNPGCGLGPI